MIHSSFSRLSGLPKTRFQGEGISSSHLPRRQSRAAHSRATFRRRSHPGRVVGEVTDEAGEEADIRGVNVGGRESLQDRKSTRLNSSHSQISYAVFCFKKKSNGRGGNG